MKLRNSYALFSPNGWLASMILVFFLVGIAHCNRLLSKSGDNASYIYLAESIATGQGYADINLAHPEPHTKYPPVLPLLLAPVFAVFGCNVALLKLVVLLTGCCGLYAIFRLVQHLSDSVTALFVVLLCATSPLYISFSTVVMTEVPYLMFSTFSLLYSMKYIEGTSRFSKLLVLAAALLMIACFTRLVGIALIGAIGLDWLVNRRSRESMIRSLLLSVPAAILVALWLVRQNAYLGQFGGETVRYSGLSDLPWAVQMLHRVVGNTKFYVETIPQMLVDAGERLMHLLPSMTAGLEAAISAVLIVASIVAAMLAMVGYLRRLRTQHSLCEFYLVVYAAILSVWPWVYDRFYLPLLPLFFFYLIVGLRLVAERLAAVSTEKWTSRWPLFLLFAPFATLTLLLALHRSTNPVILGRWSSDSFCLLVAVAVVTGLAVVCAWHGRTRCWIEHVALHRSRAVIAALLILLASWNFANAAVPPWGVTYGPEYQAYLAAMKFLRDHTPPDSIVIGRKRRLTYVWSRRHEVGEMPQFERPEQTLEFWSEHRVDYIVTGHLANGKSLDAKYVFPALEAAGAHAEEVFRDGNARVYKLHHPATAADHQR